jgi:hypothetical protein
LAFSAFIRVHQSPTAGLSASATGVPMGNEYTSAKIEELEEELTQARAN